MPTRWGMPTIDEAIPMPGAPRYFLRDWNGLEIWGYSCRSRFSEDRLIEHRAFEERGFFPAMCYSEAERDGEWGLIPMSEVTEVSEQEIRTVLDGFQSGE
jgi:hypothetical protein